MPLPDRPERRRPPACAAHGFLGPVIEIVPKGGAYLGFSFKRRNELAVYHDNKVPLLGRAKVAGQFQEAATVKDLAPVNSCLDNEFREQFDEAAHLCPAGNA